MPKSISAGLLAHLQQETTSICTCWKITRRDGVVMGFTDHDVDLLIDGLTYLAAVGYSRSAVDNDSSMSVDNLEVEGLIDDASITNEELRAGVYNKAVVEIFVVNWQDLSMGIVRIRKGWFGEVMPTSRGVFRTELRGLTQALSQKIVEVSTPECRADLGDNRCKLPISPAFVARATEYTLGQYVRSAGIAAPNTFIFKCVQAGTTSADPVAYNDTIAITTNDGTAIFICENAWTRDATVDVGATLGQKVVRLNFAAFDARADADPTWYAGGVLCCIEGPNAGNNFEVKTWVNHGGGDASFTLALAMPYPFTASDLFYLVPACDKRYVATCIGRFNNRLNFRGEPFLPGQDLLMQYPDAR